MRSIRSRAAMYGRTPEEEVLTILDNVARRPGYRSFEDALLAMPNVGLDSDFERAN
ncbi:DNA-binding protein [Pandoraea soli]|nr:DNA-binding protein [Pandoraea soli]